MEDMGRTVRVPLLLEIFKYVEVAWVLANVPCVCLVIPVAHVLLAKVEVVGHFTVVLRDAMVAAVAAVALRVVELLSAIVVTAKVNEDLNYEYIRILTSLTPKDRKFLPSIDIIGKC